MLRIVKTTLQLTLKFCTAMYNPVMGQAFGIKFKKKSDNFL